MSLSYSELVTLIEDTCQSTETTFVTRIDDFIKAAEEHIYFNTQIPNLRQNSTGTCTANNEYLALPSNYLSAYSLSVTDSGSQYYLLNREADFIREAYASRTATGRPRYYGQMDDTSLILGPTPDSSYTMELHYYFKPSSIVDTTTSWLGNNAPTCLLYGSLIHAYTFLKGDQDVMAFYQGEYEKALASLQIITEGRVRKDTYRKQNRKMDV